MRILAKYLIRLDDACPTMHGANWARLESILDSYRVKPIVAVIPDNEDQSLCLDCPVPQFWGKVHTWQDKGWSIALHGHQHVYTTQEAGIVPINSKSEFAGLSLTEQQAKIGLAWAIFTKHGLAPKIWVAPGHSFDTNTLVALKAETKIEFISDGIALAPFVEQGFTWIPQQLWHFRKLPFGLYTLCLHPNEMQEQDFVNLEQVLAKNQDNFIAWDDLDFIKKRRKSILERMLTKLFFLFLTLKRL